MLPFVINAFVVATTTKRIPKVFIKICYFQNYICMEITQEYAYKEDLVNLEEMHSFEIIFFKSRFSPLSRTSKGIAGLIDIESEI